MDKEYLQLAAAAAKEKLPDNHGYILIVAPFNQPSSPIRYAGNINREDAITILKALLYAAGSKEDWMKHVS